MVDRLTVLTPSPPVPTTSTALTPTLAGSRRAWRSMTSASSPTSAGVGTFIVIATPKAAICAGVAAPVMIWSIAQAAWPRASSRPAVNRPSTCGHDEPPASSDGNGRSVTATR
ncbi:hypothetical protein ACT16_21370 [Mycobacterium heckeshornense]|nr:hypothetical protein ACT16_21370 [Mycobacterium heckeshornense]